MLVHFAANFDHGLRNISLNVFGLSLLTLQCALRQFLSEPDSTAARVHGYPPLCPCCILTPFALLACVTPVRNCWFSTLLCLLCWYHYCSVCLLPPLPPHGYRISLSRCDRGCMIMTFIAISCCACLADRRRGYCTGSDWEHGEGEFQFLLPPIAPSSCGSESFLRFLILFPFLSLLFLILVARHKGTSYSVLHCSTPSLVSPLLRWSIQRLLSLWMTTTLTYFFLTKTWLKQQGNESRCAETTPAGYSMRSFPRPSRGGGLAVLLCDSPAHHLSLMFSFSFTHPSF